MTISGKILTPALLTLLAVLLVVASGCNKETVDEAGDAISGTVEDAKEATGDAVDAFSETAGEMKGALDQGFAAATEKATAALDGVEGGGELLAGLKNLFTSAQESLQGVTDKASAETALSKLGDLDGSLTGLSDTFGKLPNEAKSALHGVIEQGIAQLKPLAEKVLAIPGVQDVLKPKLDELMGKLQALAGDHAGS